MKRFLLATAAILFPFSAASCPMHASADPSTMEYSQAMERMHKEMHIRYSGNPDADFARAMIPHHQAAVAMARTVIAHGNDEKIKKLARFIIMTQEQEIGQMEQWVWARSYGDSERVYPVGKYETPLQQSMEEMHRAMHIGYTGDADIDFVRGMIPHHQGAIAMAEVELKYGRDPALRKLAWDIIRSQGQEIRLMERWNRKHGYAHDHIHD